MVRHTYTHTHTTPVPDCQFVFNFRTKFEIKKKDDSTNSIENRVDFFFLILLKQISRGIVYEHPMTSKQY